MFFWSLEIVADPGQRDIYHTALGKNVAVAYGETESELYG
jgi:hypothetical protein